MEKTRAPNRPGREATKVSAAGKTPTLVEVDLFGSGAKKVPTSTCPDCQTSLVNVICLGRKLRACARCRGVWLPLGVVQTLDGDGTWLKHLGPAMRAAVTTLRGSTP